ncbi:MAG: Rid family hydrolase, partial [Solirubrobacteraceae bacterium]
MAGIDRFASGGPWEARFGYSRAVRAGDIVLVAGTTAADEQGVVRGVGDAAAQTAFALDRVAAALADAGARMDQVVLTRMYVTDIGRAEEIGRAHGERFGEQP